MSITFRQLEIFEKIAATGSVTKAAEELLLTQSAVSMALAQIEQVGAPLFERVGRQLLLNDRGRSLLKDAREILLAVKQLEQILQGGSGQLTGELHVGGSTTIGNYLLPTLLGAFTKQYPGVRVELRVANTRQIAQWLEAGALDIAFTEGPYHGKRLVASHWRDDELLILTEPGHPWIKAGTVTLEMLATAPWIMREKGSGTRDIFEEAMEKAGIGYEIALEFGHTEAIKTGVAAGLGIGCLSRIAVARELDYGRLVEIESPLRFRRSLSLLRRRESRCTPLLAAFLQVSGGDWDATDA